MPHATRAGDVLAGRYRLVDLLSESGGGRFWRAHDRVLERHVALHVIAAEDPRADGLLEAARRSAMVFDPRLLRVLDAERGDGVCFVVNEWGSGTSLDIMLASNGPLSPRRGAWLVAEVADSIANAHACGVAHGLLSPENVLLDTAGSVKIIGFCVDAALHGLGPGDPQRDVVDLAGLLHATLTGRWAGVSPSAVPRVPQTHGRMLRPRQVHAGVPRVLDDLCDELLNPRGQRLRAGSEGHDSARGIQTLLAEFVGDPGGLGEAIAAGNPERTETITLPAVPEILAKPDPDDWTPGRDQPESDPAPDPEPRPDPPADPPAQPVPVAELPTQAGMPIFHEGDEDVSWLRARDEPAPPPPPFEEPPERPLFAPEPRRPRHPRPDEGPVVARGDEYWPYDSERSTGSGLAPAVEEEDERVPGRSWLRLAALVALVLVLVVTVAIAFNLGRGRTPLGAEPDPDPETPSASVSPSSTPTPFTGLAAADLDPQGDGEEHSEDVANAVDGDPATQWTTVTYEQQLGPAGLKTGVGLVVDLDQPRVVRRLDLTLVGEPTDLSIYLSDEPPATVDGLTPVATVQAESATARVTLDDAPSARYLTVWLTSLPAAADGFQGGIVDLVVAG